MTGIGMHDFIRRRIVVEHAVNGSGGPSVPSLHCTTYGRVAKKFTAMMERYRLYSSNAFNRLLPRRSIAWRPRDSQLRDRAIINVVRILLQ